MPTLAEKKCLLADLSGLKEDLAGLSKSLPDLVRSDADLKLRGMVRRLQDLTWRTCAIYGYGDGREWISYLFDALLDLSAVSLRVSEGRASMDVDPAILGSVARGYIAPCVNAVKGDANDE